MFAGILRYPKVPDCDSVGSIIKGAEFIALHTALKTLLDKKGYDPNHFKGDTEADDAIHLIQKQIDFHKKEIYKHRKEINYFLYYVYRLSYRDGPNAENKES